MTAYDVRPARARDLKHLGPIEAAGVPLFESALGDLTGDVLASAAPTGADRVAAGGTLLVAGDPPVGFVHVREIEWHAHLEQVSVHPDHMRQGIGARLVRAALVDAWHAGHHEITLCTYRDLPWNGPFYAALGFAEVPDPAAWLREIRRHERRLGLDRHGPRAVMAAPTAAR